MNNTAFLKNYQHLQYEIMFDVLKNLNFGSMAISEKHNSPFFNHILTSKLLSETHLTTLEKELANFDRKPAVYFENLDELIPNTVALEKRGYKKHWEDSWMFHDGVELDTSMFGNIEIVETETDLGEFLRTFDACYQKNDPQNPYGEVGSYLEVTEKIWHFHKGTDRETYITAYDDSGVPVAVSALTSYAGIGYISNVGSLKEVRGKGYGKKSTLFAVHLSQQLGNIYHCLATEEGQYPNNFYKRIGFRTKFTALGYVKS